MSVDEDRQPSGRDGERFTGVRRRYERATETVKGKYQGSSAEHLWSRLDAMDFINRGMLFAATLLLCFFPFLIVANALAGRSTIDGLTRHLGLNKQAAADVSQLFTSTSATSGAITGTAWVFFILGGVAAGSAIQELYERAFDLDRRGLSDFPRRLVWLAVLVGCAVAAGEAGATLRHGGGPVLLAVIGLVGFTAFFWFTMWFLLSGRVPARQLFPAALATGVCWVGMEAVFSVMFSGMVISDDTKYGAIGVIFAFMSWFIAIGVVIILGAVVGVVWRERNLSLSAGLQKLRRKRPVPAETNLPAETNRSTS